MAKKLIGYIIALIGLAGLVSTTFPELKSQIPQLATLNNTTLTIISIVILIIGIILTLKKSTIKALKEVPIFEGKDVVGYRRDKN